MNLLHDQLATGTKIRVLTVVGTFWRFTSVLDASLSDRGEDVFQTLDRVTAAIFWPKTRARWRETIETEVTHRHVVRMPPPVRDTDEWMRLYAQRQDGLDAPPRPPLRRMAVRRQ